MKAISAGGRHQSPRSPKKSPVPATVLAAAVLTVALIQLVDHTIEPEEPEVSRDTPVVYVAEEPTYETNEDPDMGVDPCPSYTAEELEMMAITIYKEAGSDDISDETRIMVGNVVQNRMADSRFHSTMREVLMQKGQFNTFYWDGIVWPESAEEEPEAVERAYECARRVLSGEKLLEYDVVWCAEFPQGTETVLYLDGFYFCRG